MKLNFASASTLALIAACAAPSFAMAQDGNVDAIIVTGTRTTGLRAVDSPAPVSTAVRRPRTSATSSDTSGARDVARRSRRAGEVTRPRYDDVASRAVTRSRRPASTPKT